MGEKRRRTKSFKIRRKTAAGKTSPATQGRRRARRGRVGPCHARRVGPCHARRVGAREPSKIFSKNFPTLVTSSETYPEDERIQGRHGGYDPSTYQ
ncbi:hypothetical protein ACFX2G_009340 [Malus domestica]